jgi:dTDP-4-amino-4,6-dideoxygalactose transaminase
MKKLPLTIQNGLSQEYIKYKEDIDKAIIQVLNGGRYVLGEELERFEERFAELVGTKYAVGVGNGFDALYISLSCLHIRHPQVYICKPSLHISTRNAVWAVGGTVVEREEEAEVVIPTIHPTFYNDMSVYRDVITIEDACQSIGMKRKVPDYVTTSCYSFHPLKKLHCYGDGGAIVLNDGGLCKSIKEFRNHGRAGITDRYGIGVNSRLDEIQAAVLNVMMDKLKGEI